MPKFPHLHNGSQDIHLSKTFKDLWCWFWRSWKYLNGVVLFYLDWNAKSHSCYKPIQSLRAIFCWLFQTFRSWKHFSWLEASVVHLKVLILTELAAQKMQILGRLTYSDLQTFFYSRMLWAKFLDISEYWNLLQCWTRSFMVK